MLLVPKLRIFLTYCWRAFEQGSKLPGDSVNGVNIVWCILMRLSRTFLWKKRYFPLTAYVWKIKLNLRYCWYCLILNNEGRSCNKRKPLVLLIFKFILYLIGMLSCFVVNVYPLGLEFEGVDVVWSIKEVFLSTLWHKNGMNFNIDVFVWTESGSVNKN